MKATVYIPFANGDAVNGFRYDGEELTSKKYVRMEEDEYYNHRDGVDTMMPLNGTNIAANGFTKRKFNIKNQAYAFHKCDGNIRNIDNTDVTVTQLDRLWANKEQFGLFVYLDEQQFNKKPDLETDLKIWIQDSQKIMNITRMSDEEKVLHLPKKDFKIDFDNGKSHAVLKNCKFAKLMSSARKPVSKRCNICGYENQNPNVLKEWTCPKCGTTHRGEPIITSFAMIIERIIFTKK